MFQNLCLYICVYLVIFISINIYVYSYLFIFFKHSVGIWDPLGAEGFRIGLASEVQDLALRLRPDLGLAEYLQGF